MTEAMKVEVRADFAQFEKALLKLQNQTDAGLARVEKRVARSNQTLRREGSQTTGVFTDLQRSAAGAVGGLPGLGAGMGTVGIAGGVAAVGVGALVAALRGVQDAAKFADQLAATANRIGVTAEALQELRYAADETDVPITALESGLEALNGTLGAFKTGIGAGRIKPIFEALGLTQADLANVENARDLLPILADRLGQVSSRAEQVQLAKKLGIEALLPILRLGSAEIRRMADEGRDLGFVMSNDVVNGLADTDRALEKNKQQIDANVREMQASMAPFFVWASGEIAKLARGLGDFFNGLRSAQGRTDRVLEQQVESGQERVDFATRQARDTGRPMSQVQEGWVRELATARAELARRRQEREREAVPSAADRTREGGFNLDTPDAPPTGGGARGGGGRSTDTARAAEEAQRRQRRFDDDLAGASEAAMQAQSQLATTAEQRASIAIQLLDSDRQQRALQLERQVTDGDLTAAQRDRIVEAESGVWTARQANIAAELQRSLLDTHTQVQDQALAVEMAALVARREIVGTDEERLAVDREILAIHQGERRRALEQALLSEELTAAQRALLQAALDQLGSVEKAEGDSLVSPGVQAAKDVLGAIGNAANSGARMSRDRDDALAYINAQETAGLASHQDAMNARAQIDQQYWNNRLIGEGSMLDSIASLQNSSIKELAALGKAAALAQAAIAGFLAIQVAVASAPFPFNLPAIAFATAQTAVNMAGIAGVGLKDGGDVIGPGGPRDDKVLIWGSNGEYMMNAKATAKNRPYLEAANRGADLGKLVPGFANGGVIGRINAATASVSASAARPATTSLTFAPVINAPGADMAAVRAIKDHLTEQERSFADRVNGVREKRARYRMGGRR